jgi:hypothetical protein
MTREETAQNADDRSILEWLFSGNATAKLLDFLVTYTDTDYSETDIAGLAGISLRTAFREIPKFESVGLIAFTRKVGRAKMYKLNPNSEAAKHLQQFAFDIATKRIDNTMKAIESRQEKLVINDIEEGTMTSKQEA